MLPCSEPYIKSLQECGIKATIPNDADCCWISSVYGDEVSHVTDSLSDTYWSNNMVRPVLFSQAVSYAFSETGPFEVALHATRPTRATNSEQLTSAQAEMKAIWAQVIPGELSESHDIGPKTDFFHVGGTSLLLVNLQSLLKQKYVSAPPLHKLLEASTLESTASFAGRTEIEVPVQHINWELEADLLPSEIYTVTRPSSTNELRLAPPHLTGATGFLGKQILSRLLQLPSIQAILCIAVLQDLDSVAPVFQDPRIILFPGDLASPTLDLTSDETEMIFSQVGLIIHNRADISFMKAYQSLQRTKVNPKKYLAQLAVPRRIPFHFISPANVAQLTGLDTIGEISFSKWASGPDADGYTAAKGMAERHLEKMNEQFGLWWFIDPRASRAKAVEDWT